MKEIILKKLTLHNFKGGSLSIEPDGANLDIYGTNEAGKTRIYDSFSWLLFGKDSLDQANFDIKTLDQNGNCISGGEDHFVEAALSVDGKPISLKRLYRENWTQRRGDADKTFTGHKTDYYINDVPMIEKEYKTSIDDICPEMVFKLLTNPKYFNEVLATWNGKKTTQTDARRKLIFEVCGVDVTDEDVIKTNPDLEPLIAIVAERSLEDHRKIAKSRQAKISEEKKGIPARIDEQRRSADKDLREEKTVSAALSIARSLVREKQDALVMIENGGQVVKLKKELAEIETKITNRENQLEKERQKKLSEAGAVRQKKIDEVDKKIQNVTEKIRSEKSNNNQIYEQTKRLETDIAHLRSEAEQLRKKWIEVDAKKPEFHQDETCPTCGQAIPQEKLDDARKEFIYGFNEHKATELNRISELGGEKVGLIELREKSLSEEMAIIEKSNEKIVDLTGKKTELEKERAAILSEPKIEIETDTLATYTRSHDRKLADLEKQKSAIKTNIEEAQESDKPDTEDAKAEIEKAEANVTALSEELYKSQAATKTEQRVEELKEQERTLSAEFEKLSHELYLLDEFEKAKVTLIEGTVNSKFLITKIKLFDVQINGGIDPCCIATYNGVPYNSMNNAARINCGIDIQSVLSNHYGVSIVTFIDNAESVAALLPTRAQQIRLIVSANDKTLRIEKEETDHDKAE